MLRALLADAATEVPYWRERLSPTEDLLQQFHALPPLTKDTVRQQGARMHSGLAAQRRSWRTHSGGSSGTPIEVLQDRELVDWSMATSAWYLAAHLGIEHDVPNVVLWGSERDLFGHRRGLEERARAALTQTTFLNSFRMDAATMARYVGIIAALRPVYIRGYAGSLYQLARFVEQRGLRLHRPRFVYSAAETLQPEMRTTIERAFGAPAYDFYGSREVGPIAGQGQDGALHVFGFFNLVEVVDDANRPVGRGGHGRVLVTTLHNHVMPLLRYELGDTAEVGQVDADGAVRTLRRVTGRITDHFVAADGALIHGEYFTHLFYGIAGVREFQIIQHRVDQVEILWVPFGAPGGRPAPSQEIDSKIRLVLGARCEIVWTEVGEVPLTPQGKRLFTRCLVSRGERR